MNQMGKKKFRESFKSKEGKEGDKNKSILKIK